MFNTGLVDLPHSLPAGHDRMLIASGKRGTEQTIAEMAKLVTAHKRNFRVRELVGSLIAECPKKDYACYAKACFNYCRDRIQYAFDPSGVEMIENPDRILDAGIADCDSICVLLASMFENLGFPSRFVTIKADPSRPEEYSHVYVQCRLPHRGWVSADATMPHEFGWEPDKMYARTNWPASNDEPEVHDEPTLRVSGMGSIGAWESDGSLVSAGDQQLELSSLSGLGALGADFDASVLTILNNVDNGTYSVQLKTMRDYHRNLTGDLYVKMRDNPNNAAYAKAYNANQEALTAANEAITKYNELLSTIQTYTYGAATYPQLSGMGVAPIAWAGVAIAGVAVISAAAYAFADVLRAAQGKSGSAKGYIEQVGYTVESGAKVLDSFGNLGIIAMVGAVLFVGYQFLQKKGKLA